MRAASGERDRCGHLTGGISPIDLSQMAPAVESSSLAMPQGISSRPSRAGAGSSPGRRTQLAWPHGSMTCRRSGFTASTARVRRCFPFRTDARIRAISTPCGRQTDCRWSSPPAKRPSTVARRSACPRTIRVRTTGGRTLPHGTLVAYAIADSLVIADADGTELLRISPRAQDGTVGFVDYLDLVWSPSSDQVAFSWYPVDTSGYSVVSAFTLQVLDVSSEDLTTLAAEPGIVPIRFSAEGDQLLVATHDANYAGTGLWSLTVDSSDLQMLVPGTAWGDWQPQPAEE